MLALPAEEMSGENPTGSMTREELALEVESLRFLANEANRRAATAEGQMETMMEQLRELESRIPQLWSLLRPALRCLLVWLG